MQVYEVGNQMDRNENPGPKECEEWTRPFQETSPRDMMVGLMLLSLCSS